MGGSQSRVEEHDATPSEPEQASGAEVKPTDKLVASLEEQQRRYTSSRSHEETNTEIEHAHQDSGKEAQVAQDRVTLQQQEESRAHALWVTEKDEAARLSRMAGAISSSMPEADRQHGRGACSREVQDVILCYRAHEKAAGGVSPCAKLLDALEACTLVAASGGHE